MTYVEMPCRICGVSFNMSRFRAHGEPARASWHNTGYGVRRVVPTYTDISNAECAEGGCYFTYRPYNSLPPGGAVEFLPPRPFSKWEILDYEHIAGPGCARQDGYSGARISVEAMQGCTTMQCLVAKRDGVTWEPEPGDEAFETEGHHFLTGLCDNMPCRGELGPLMYPARHGSQVLELEIWPGEGPDCPLSFHPSCLEIYKRASLDRRGDQDIDDLIAWDKSDRANGLADHFPRDPAVDEGRQEYWRHIPGHEYLAANPCFVPELDGILAKARRASSCGGGAAAAAHTVADSIKDVFLTLPYDVRFEVALYLSLRDLVHLDGVSSAFRDLPQSLYYAKLRCEMPWFYEAWCSLPISRWATKTAVQISAGEQPVELPMEPLDRDTTDWASLAVKLLEAEAAVPGLRNRRRIWKDCGEILRRIDYYNGKGPLDDDWVQRVFGASP